MGAPSEHKNIPLNDYSGYNPNGAGASQSYRPPSPPPPAYQDGLGNSTAVPATNMNNNMNDIPMGQTFYQPPPTPMDHAPPLPADEPDQRNRIVQFYAPPDNRRLGVMRRLTSCLCCICIIALVIGLAAGLTTHRYDNRYCECRTNMDCMHLYVWNCTGQKQAD
ncbi:hypothetical protein BDF20DRAFT_839470 [Mycotypha africana]|uniref:uncharacterized protein n=1 Tax=Mycotypha africana TaxID=64632 RepID=UPI002301B561|nr:uncharacterized protein BDF20DRAFT_839470 [Mycotypha africana]KAI8968354.1 hypothetical protein BDF20DRAFT_839470 [Mycotypha africana]